jgi:hypothetical protein
MRIRLIEATILVSVLGVACAAQQSTSTPKQPDSSAEFRQVLQMLAPSAPDPCSASPGKEEDWRASDAALAVFTKAAEIVTQALNATSSDAPEKRATAALKTLEQASAAVNSAWPEENRFRFQTLEVSPLLLVKMSVRAHETFYVFGIPEEESGKPNRLWREVGSDEITADRDGPRARLNLFPLHRGPSRSARFLVKSITSGCAGSLGIAYDAREWSPKGAGELAQIIEQDGALGLDDKVPDFEPIGKLQTEGSLVTLPYCWFSPIDTWDNPSLCAVDSYDLEGDQVRFRSRTFNRPDLVPVAKAIEYAEKRDYPAVLGYCVSEDIARAMVREMPPDVLADDLQVTRLSNGKERVELGDPTAYEFEVEKRADRWVVSSFSAE